MQIKIVVYFHGIKMISTSDLQAFLEKIDGQSGVDLVKIGQTFGQPQGNGNYKLNY